MRLRQDYVAEQLKNEEFKVAYDEWEPDFEIADALLQFRADNDLTQKKLAKMIGINRSDLSKLESASANPTLRTLKKIAVALGANLNVRFELKVSAVPIKAFGTNILKFSNSTKENDSHNCDSDKYSVSLNDSNEPARIDQKEHVAELALA